MAGHSKWKNIKHKKAAADKAKAKKFTKLLKEITICARAHGNIDTNPTLKTLIAKANEMNMPKDNYIRAIKRGLGEIEGAHYEAFTYEGYAPHNVAVIVEMLSDNKNKAASEIRAAFNRNDGILSDLGSVKWMFEKSGLINAQYHGITEEMALEWLLDYTVSECSIEDDTISIVCDFTQLNEIQKVLIDQGCTIEEAVIGYHPHTVMTTLNDEQQQKVMDFLSTLEDLEDVQHVYAAL